MLGCLTFLIILISRLSRSRSASFYILHFYIILIATCSLVILCFAIQTLLNVPAPIFLPSTKLCKHFSLTTFSLFAKCESPISLLLLSTTLDYVLSWFSYWGLFCRLDIQIKICKRIF